MLKVKINEVKTTIASKYKPVSTKHINLYPKLSRKGISSDKLNDIFKRAVSKSQNKYDLLDININDPDKLKDTYNSEMGIKSTCSNNIKYDMHDVFTVTKPHQYPNEFETVNLYMDYPPPTSAEVAQIYA